MSLPGLHRERDRAESFGSVAEDYDRHRPEFPAALLDDLAALGGTSVLDIGCGTGKVARGLAQRGMHVLGVDVDARMADVARRHGVEVEVSRFEDWEDAGRQFDLVACGDAWHWLEPKRSVEVVARVLRAGGTFARFFNMQSLDDEVMGAVEGAYRKYAPESFAAYGRMPPMKSDSSVFALDERFSQIEERSYSWERRVSGAEWAAFMGTISVHQRLPREQLGELQAAVRGEIEKFGETIRVRVVTTGFFARRVS